MSSFFAIENLSVTYGKRNRKTYAVQDVSFSLEQGKSIGIVGESGCGKTTVALAAMGLLDPRTQVTGTMHIGEEKYDLSEMTYKRWRSIRGNDIAMVFQDSLASLNPLKKIGEQIAEAIYVKRSMSKRDARIRAIDLLDIVEIPDPERRAGQYPHECSGGMRQRAMIAMALANNPKVLICDEPTTALDVTVQAQVLATIKKLQEELEMSVILVTHDLGVINSVTDNVLVMYASKIVESGETSKLMEEPHHPYTSALLKAMPDLAVKNSLHAIPGVPPTLNKIFDYCPFAPRCENVTDECKQSMPDLELENKRALACFNPMIKVEA